MLKHPFRWFGFARGHDLRLPRGYCTQPAHVLYDDIPGDIVFQPHVYKLANFLATRASAGYVIDIGCGAGEKLALMRDRFNIIGIDSPSGVDTARQLLPDATLIQRDLEQGLPEMLAQVLREAIVICSGVVEHMRNPMPLLSSLAQISRVTPYVLVSTPDRDRARSWLDCGPPANTSHVREWSSSEFARLLLDAGFRGVPLHGHTINNNVQRARTTSLVVCGTHALPDKSIAQKKIAAIIHGFNEVDILPEVVQHLARQRVEIHYFDNWSTDGSWELASRFRDEGLIRHCERFPEQPGDQFEWRTQLQKTSAYAATLDADWVMHHDADEIRIAPWQGVSLAEAISYVDALGFNAIDFTVLDFRFTKDRPACTGPFEQALTHFEFGRRPGHFSQVKCWKNEAGEVDLASSGGHHAALPEQKVFPVKFLLKHYPLRNRQQANCKVFEQRLPRFENEKKKYGWHSHYDQFLEQDTIDGWHYYELQPYHRVHFDTEYLVERISGIGLRDD